MKKDAPFRVLPLQIVSRYKLDEILGNGGRHYSHCISIGDTEESEPPAVRGAFEKLLTINQDDYLDELEPAED